MRKSHQVRRPTLRRNRRAPCAHIRPLRLDGTQGTDPDRPEEVERARGADMARRWRVSKTPREPMSLPCAKPLLRRERPPAAMPALLPINARAPAKTSPPDRTKRARQRSEDPGRLRRHRRIQANRPNPKSRYRSVDLSEGQ